MDREWTEPGDKERLLSAVIFKKDQIFSLASRKSVYTEICSVIDVCHTL